jgi:hypothetical protein
MIIVSFILIALAAICSALQDTITHHWYGFRWKDRVSEAFWNPQISWKNKYNPIIIGGYKIPRWSPISDVWHILKSTQIVLLCVAISLGGNLDLVHIWFWDTLITVIILGSIWNGSFNLFYNRIFFKKPIN